MPRKFISFLGAIPYEPARYFFDNNTALLSQPTVYVQEAIFEKVLTDWQPTDAVIIFTTEQALHYNYQNRITRGEGLLEGKGLEQILQRLSQQGRIGLFSAVNIPNGNTEEEIWAVFQTVFQSIAEGDELYFDITYGFRSLPMLGMVLLDYVRTLQQVKIRRIFYGNYEAGRNNQRPGEVVNAPVLDLTPFAQLQEWTAAARAFLQGGNAEPIASLTEQNNPEISRNLRLFAPAILTCRGLQITKDIDISSFKTLVDSSLTLPIAAQLRPLLEKIQEKLSPFSSDNLQNGLNAVKWCIDNGLIQQGYTFLQETMVSIVLERVLSSAYLTERKYRTNAGAALNGIKPDRLRLRSDETIPNDEYTQLFDYVQRHPGLVDLYKRLIGHDGLRNDINHCGFKTGYAMPSTLKDELSTLYQHLIQINLQ
ncbi:MAG: TIGR02221 family CRISPR-associated protein [Saprospiraceae bacterium]|nr:TIGR02221 family CRISPR-associated protein [Saprospiraceae bacterium]